MPGSLVSRQTREAKSRRFVLRLSFIRTDPAWLRSLPRFKKIKRKKSGHCVSVCVCESEHRFVLGACVHPCIVVLTGEEQIAERPFLLFNTADKSAENKQLLINHWEKLRFSSETTGDVSRVTPEWALVLHTCAEDTAVSRQREAHRPGGRVDRPGGCVQHQQPGLKLQLGAWQRSRGLEDGLLRPLRGAAPRLNSCVSLWLHFHVLVCFLVTWECVLPVTAPL